VNECKPLEGGIPRPRFAGGDAAAADNSAAAAAAAADTSAYTAAAAPAAAAVDSMGIRALKEYITANGGSSAGLVEKSELVAAAKDVAATSATGDDDRKTGALKPIIWTVRPGK